MRIEDVNQNIGNVVAKSQANVNNEADVEVFSSAVDETKQDNTQLPVEGYYIEKTTDDDTTENETVDENDADDDFDRNINPEERISISPSIALNQVSNELTSALEQAVDKSSNSGIDSDNKTYAFFVQAQSLADNKDPNAIFGMNFGKRLNVYGKGIYEYANYDYSNPVTNIKYTDNSHKVEIGGTFSSKSGNTKAVFLGSGTKSNTKVKTDVVYGDAFQSSQNDSNVDEAGISPDIHDNYSMNSSIYNAFIAGQQKFKNNDVLTANAFYNNDGLQKSNTTSVNADYYLNKFGAHLSVGTSVYNGEDNVHTTKTNFNCTFNPESNEAPAANEEVAAEDTADNQETEQTVNTEVKANVVPDKKWKLAVSPFFDTQAIDGSPEEGLGVQVRLKKQNNSTVKFNGFGKFSTTQKEEESNLYHITTGVGARYATSVGRNGVLQAKADIKDKFTFGNGNIFTATGKVAYTMPKTSAEIEGKYITVPNSKYAGVVGRVSYTPSKNVHTFAEASYIDWKHPEGRLNGTSANVGALINF